MLNSIMALGISASVLIMLAAFSRIPALLKAVADPTEPRIPGLDGLRGLLAVCVFGHHCIVMRNLTRTGMWADPAENLVTLMGQGAVAVFFMVSSYLFVGKIIQSSGRLTVPIFLIGRIARLVPLYVLAVLFALVIVAVLSKFRLQEPAQSLLYQMRGWWGFGFMTRLDVNGVEHSSIMVSPFWSLRFELLLYSILPFLAFGIRRGLPDWGTVVLLLLAALYSTLFVYFATGAAVYLLHKRGWCNPRSKWLVLCAASCIALLPLASSVLSPICLLLMPVIFFCCLKSEPISKFLDSNTLRFAGQISYSVYLLHLPTIFLFTFVFFGSETVARQSDSYFFLSFCAVGILIGAISTAAFLIVEKRGIECGHGAALFLRGSRSANTT